MHACAILAVSVAAIIAPLFPPLVPLLRDSLLDMTESLNTNTNPPPAIEPEWVCLAQRFKHVSAGCEPWRGWGAGRVGIGVMGRVK